MAKETESHAAENATHVEGTAETHVAVEDHGGAHGGSPLDVSAEMFVWTLGTFIVMAFLLTKLAWRPILESLDRREQDLRDSVDNAEKIKQELSTIDEKRSHIIGEADQKAKDIVDRGRRAGKEAESVIKDKAKEEATILMENAEREISTARNKAEADLKRDSVEMALSLAGKVIGEKMDPEKHKELTDRLIGQL